MHWPWYQDQQCIKMIRHTIFEGQFSIYLISSRVFLSVGVILFFFISLFFAVPFHACDRRNWVHTMYAISPSSYEAYRPTFTLFSLQLYYYAYIYGIFSRYEISCMHPSLSNFADIALSKAPTGRCQ